MNSRSLCTLVSFALALGVMSVSENAFAQLGLLQSSPRPSLPQGLRLVDEVVASLRVDGDDRGPVHVTARELELALLVQVAERTDGALDQSVSRTTLEQLLAEKLLERDAVRAGDPVPDDRAVRNEASVLDEKAAAMGGRAALLARTQLSERDWMQWARRRLMARAYLRKQYPRMIEPTDAELRTQLERGPVDGCTTVACAREAGIVRSYPRALVAYLRGVGSRSHVRLWQSSLNR